MSLLFSPIKLNGITLKNRILVSPMCQYSAEDGFANDWHLVHLGGRAVGGAALIIFEATAVSPEGRISPKDIGIWKEEHIEKLRQINDFIHKQNAYAGVQLAHAGRKASTLPPWEGNKQVPQEDGGWQPVAPSALPFHQSEVAPIALDRNGIEKVITDFKNAAVRAVAAGFDLIEIHAAHGYLLHQFLSPLSNKREDEYGGSFENRVRLLLEVVSIIRKTIPEDMPLLVRISATDYAEGGWDLEQSVQLSTILKDNGVDMMDVSSGALIPGVKIPVGPGYQVDFAERIKKDTSIITGAVGLITTAEQAEEILAENRADVILLARELLRNPYFPLSASIQLDGDATYPLQYERAKPKV